MANFALITIGDELINGEFSNKNSQIVARILQNKGHNLRRVITVGDDKTEIIHSVKSAVSNFKNIIVTGGLGPTQDDITRKAIAEACNRKLKYNDNIANKITDYFREKSIKMTDNNFRQAYFPEDAKIISNPEGTAPGFKLKFQGSLIYVLPGVTLEMSKMLKNQLQNSQSTEEYYNEQIFKVAGLGEAELEDKLKKIIQNSHHKYRFLPHGGEIEIRIKQNPEKDNCHKSDFAAELNKIQQILGNHIFSQKENIGLPEKLKEISVKRGITLSLAESCTGGWISKRITDVPGCSEFFLGGIIAYNDNVKNNLLNVKTATLKNHGAVSEKTAAEMSAGVNELTNSTISASVTGIAGPGGGTEYKPVGLVYFSLFHEGSAYTKKWNFSGTRKRVRWFTSQFVLNNIRLYILEELS